MTSGLTFHHHPHQKANWSCSKTTLEKVRRHLEREFDADEYAFDERREVIAELTVKNLVCTLSKVTLSTTQTLVHSPSF
jgi:hypothetical protein